MDTSSRRPPGSLIRSLRQDMNDLEFDRLTSLDMEDLVVRDQTFTNAIEGYRLMGYRSATEEVVFMTDTQNLYEYYLKYNTALDAPYHNHYHVACMLANCYEGAVHEKLDPETTRLLVIAALFHDFDHTAGRHDDMTNIKVAQLTVASLVQQGLLNAYDADVVRDLISVTQYPFIHEPKTAAQRIIRDADLMQPYEGSDIQLLRQYRGLKVEVENKLQRPVSDDEFTAGMGKFFREEVTWYTEWARNKAVALGWDYKVAQLLGMLGGVQVQ